MAYQAKHRKMRFSTKIGLIRIMWSKRMMTTTQAIGAIFA
jgi:hypothetical protein